LLSSSNFLFLWGLDVVHRWWQVDHWWWWSLSSCDFDRIENVRDILVLELLIYFTLECCPLLFISSSVDKFWLGGGSFSCS
jgi:hypothetical protein